MGKNVLLRLENGLKWLQKSVCLLENCPFEPFSGVQSGFKPTDTGASSYSFNSKTTQLRNPAKSVVSNKSALGRRPSHISRKANRETSGLGGIGFDHQRANGFNHLR